MIPIDNFKVLAAIKLIHLRQVYILLLPPSLRSRLIHMMLHMNAISDDFSQPLDFKSSFESEAKGVAVCK